MPLAPDKTSLVLKSGTIKRGVWTNAHLIGTNATRPRDFFSGVVLGTIKAGTQVCNLARTFVEFLSKTPRALFAKDVIQQPFTLEGEVAEFTGDSMQIFLGRTAQLAYAVTVPATETWDIIHIGSDSPAMDEAGYLVQAADRSGREFEIAIYAGLLTAEDQSVTMSGDDYATLKIKVEATELVAQTDAQKNYGYIARKVA